ncbi:MAG: NAD-dependent epimerase/dehydratase family protein [Acidimicrobiales bacterium]
MPAPLHLVVGAGPVGTAVADQLVDAGANVRIVTRSGGGPEHPAVERVAADAANTERLTALGRGAVAIYNCVNPSYHRWTRDWPPVATALLAAAEAADAVLVTCSNLYVYGPTPAALTEPGLGEDLPLAATGVKGRVRARMWADALAAHEAGRVRVTEVRGSDYLGATANSQVGDTVVPRLLRGRTARVIGDPTVPHAFTHVADVARLLVTAAADERAWGRAWHVPSHPARPIQRVVDDLAEVAGVPTVRVAQIPAVVRRGAALVVPFLREMPEVMHQHNRPWHLDSRAAQTTFDLHPTPWEEILRHHLAPYLVSTAAA